MPGRPDDPQGPNAGEPIGEYVQLPAVNDDPYTITETPDGGMVVQLGTPYEAPQPNEGFFVNLADVTIAGTIPEPVQDRVITDLIKRIEEDKESRKKRDEQYEEGIKRTGLGNDAPGGAAFTGASRIVHPMLTEACIDYESRVIKELWPYSGPAKPKILGVVTSEKTERARRKTEWLNYQLTEVIEEARSVMETTLTQVPLGGVGFIWQYWDHGLKRPKWQFVPVDKVYLPFSAADFASSHRKTFVDTITATEYRERVNAGMYRKLTLSPVPDIPEQSKAEKASDKVEGKEGNILNIDAERDIYFCQVTLEITAEMADILGHEQEGELRPYIITIDVQTKKALAWYRDWEENDPTAKPIEHLYEFPFIPWRGAYSIGFPQIIGGLSGGATGALRALLDAAFIDNAQGGLIFKGAGVSGQSATTQPGEWKEIEKPLDTDDIRKVAMPFSAKGPSSVLFQLLGFLVDAAKGTVRTSLDETPAMNNTQVPVGTQMSRVEEGLVVFSSIHGRIHTAFNRLLAGLHRLNRMYLPEIVQVDAQGKEIMIRRRDFEGPVDIQPVSDPTIYSDQQRFAQVTAIQQRSTMVPQLYKAREVEKAFLKLMKWPDPETILTDEPQPHELNAVNENLAMVMNRPVVVFPEQDHLAHLQVHLDFMRSPALGSNPLMAPQFLPAALKHCIEHIAYQYVAQTNAVIKAASGRDGADLMSTDDHVKQRFDQLLAMVSQHVVPGVQASMQGALPTLMQCVSLLKQLAPPQPGDPAQAAVQAAAAETGRKAKADQQQGALKLAQIQSNERIQQQKNAIYMDRNQISRENAELEANERMQEAASREQTAEDIESSRIASGAGQRFSTGSSFAS
jgi:hypothetical protein